MSHEKLNDKTVAHLVRQGYGHKIDPDRLTPDHQVIMAAKGVEYHHALMKAKNLDHDAKFMIAAFADDSRKKALRKHNLDQDTKLAMSGRMNVDLKGHVASPHDSPVQRRYHEVKRRYFEAKDKLFSGNF